MNPLTRLLHKRRREQAYRRSHLRILSIRMQFYWSRHQPSICNVEQLLTVGTPAGMDASTGGNTNTEAGWKLSKINVSMVVLIDFLIGDPFSIRGKLRSLIGTWRLDHGQYAARIAVELYCRDVSASHEKQETPVGRNLPGDA